MVKPKHSFGKKEYVVNTEFVDREEAKDVYREKLLNNMKDYNIVTYYGVGGVGKSMLKNELLKIHTTEFEGAFTMSLDLKVAENRCLETGLLKLVDSCSKKINFKSFELAYALFYKKKYPHNTALRGKNLISDNSLVNAGLSIVSLLDGGVTSVSAPIIEKLIRKIGAEFLDDDVKTELNRFEKYSVEEIEERLPLFLRYDIKRYLDKHPTAKVLLIFDTFEALNENVIDDVHRLKNERWLQDVISYFPSEEFPTLLVAIFGRDKIRWDDDWDELIDQYHLSELSDEYANRYLKQNKIEEADIKTQIIKTSKGLPLMMYLMVETYMNIKNEGKTPAASDFCGDYRTVIERFLYNLDKNTIDALRLMSVPNYYTTEIFMELVRKFYVSYSMTEYVQFNNYSFVSFEESEGVYYIHDLIRREVQRHFDKKIQNEANEFMMNYYSEKALLNDDNALREMFFHASKYMNADKFNLWLNKELENGCAPIHLIYEAQVAGKQSLLMQILGNLVNQYGLNVLDIKLINIYIDIVHLGGMYEQAVSICDEFLLKYEAPDIINSEQLIKMRVRRIHHSMFYKPVDKLLLDAKWLLTNTGVSDYPEVYNELLFLIGGNLGVLSGNFDEADAWLAKSAQFAKAYDLQSFLHRTIRKQVDLLIYAGKTESALDLVNDYIPDGADVDTRYKIYMCGSKGEAYRKRKDLANAERCFDIVERKSNEYNLPGWKSHAQLAKGMCCMMRGNYSEARAFYGAAETYYTKANHEWGKINVKTALLLLELEESSKVDINEVSSCLENATKMGYGYNIDILNKIKDSMETDFQLFFL